VINDRLGDDCIVLLDDAFRRSERRVLERWRRLRPLRIQRFGPGRAYCQLALAPTATRSSSIADAA
jgi:hypothetical protein